MGNILNKFATRQYTQFQFHLNSVCTLPCKTKIVFLYKLQWTQGSQEQDSSVENSKSVFNNTKPYQGIAPGGNYFFLH